MSKEVIVFDLDDTLYLERDYVRSGFKHVGQLLADEFQVTGCFEYLWGSFEQGIRGDTFNRLIKEFELPQDALQFMVQSYRDHQPDIEFATDAALFLAELKSNGVPLGIITDGYGKGQWQKIRSLGVENLIDHIVVTHDRGSDWTKPSPLPFQFIESQFPAGYQFCYIGDNPSKDFQSPHKLGWKSVRIRRSGSLHESVDTPAYVALEVAELPLSANFNADPSKREK